MNVTRVIQIRLYVLQPGCGAAFHQLMSSRCLPLLKAAGTEVIGLGPSLHAPDAYYLLRAYDNAQDLQRSQDAFYGSAAWREGPRTEVLALIENYMDAVVQLTPEAVEAIRRSHELIRANV
jgi:hypothetical protein